MSTFNGGPQSIVTNGLVLYLDAANRNSYVSGSTIWNDLSISRNNATLVNGVGFNSSFAGGLINDNVDDYIDTNYSMSVSTFSVSMWAQRTFSSFWSILWASEVWNNNTGYVAYFPNENQITFSRGGGTGFTNATVTNSDRPALYTFSLNSSGTVKIYQNATLVREASITLATSIEKTIKLNTRHSNDGSGFTDRRFGNFYMFQYYNRVLSDAEVLQNYNSTKARFGF
jgi:hypothetical protein